MLLEKIFRGVKFFCYISLRFASVIVKALLKPNGGHHAGQ